MTKASKTYCKQLHTEIFRFVRKQRFVGLKYGVPQEQIGGGLSHTEESILFILYSEPEKNVKELSELIGLERSWMSRVVSALEKKEYVKSYTPDFDRRSKKLLLTSKGKKKLLQVENFVSDVMKECVSTIDQSEQACFHDYLQKLADGLGAKHYENNSSTNAIAYQLGRLSAGFGMYAERMFGTEITVTYLHTLLILEERSDYESQVGDIHSMLPSDISTTSRTLQAFEKKNWIYKFKSKRDKRSYSVQLSESGKELLKSYYSNVTSIFQKALKDFTQEELDHFLKLYQKVATEIPYPVTSTKTSQVRLQELQKSVSNTQIKNLMSKVERFQESKNIKQLGLYESGELKAILKLTKNPKDNSIISLDFNGHSLKSDEVLSIIQSCLKLS